MMDGRAAGESYRKVWGRQAMTRNAHPDEGRAASDSEITLRE
jgi:hypothetical protein